jgi:large subunit ribosomal protein L5
MSRLQDQYRKNVVPALQKTFGIKNIMAVPKITKININMGIGRMTKDDKAIAKAERDLALLTGQKPVSRKAKKSIASFKVREGVVIGLSVTLRGKRMYDFLDRFISIALPMSKDFRGINKENIDRDGNLNIGIREHNIFPEVTYETLKDLVGLQVTMTTSGRSKEQGLELFKLMGVPFTKN